MANNERKRILLVMDQMDQLYFFGRVQKDDSPFMFSGYEGNFEEGSVAAYMKEHGGEFDAVAVYDARGYDTARIEILENYSGPKILLDVFQRDVKGDFIRVDMFVLPSGFDQIVSKIFSGETTKL